MSENPYKAPSAIVRPIHSDANRQRLKRIAVLQKSIIAFFMIHVLAYVAASLYIPPGNIQNDGWTIVTLGLYAIGLFQAVFVFVLARHVYNLVVAIVLMPLAFWPCVSLLVLLMVNQKASWYLKSNGISVGFFGVKLSDYNWD